MRIRFILLMAAFALAGCSNHGSVSKSQCVAGDWQTVGYRDGVHGQRSTRLLAHQDACGEHGVIPDREQYMVGWDQGIREYCESLNGFVVGERGQMQNNVCPEDLKPTFTRAYQEGRSLYLARTEVTNLEGAIYRCRARIDQIEVEMVSSVTAQLNPVLTPAARIELIAQVKWLEDEKRRLHAEIPALESELAIRTQELEDLESSMASVAR